MRKKPVIDRQGKLGNFHRSLERMVNRNLIRSLDGDDELSQEIESAVATLDEVNLELGDNGASVDLNAIVEGRVVRIKDDYAVVDVGFKSEGMLPLREWEEGEELPQVGEKIKVLIEDMDDGPGAGEDPYSMLLLSKRKAEKIIAWQEMMQTVQEGQVVTGTVIRKIKGGLLVDIGVNVFLPASQVDIRRPSDIGDYIGRAVQCEVLKIDEARRNIVVSRRSLIERQRQEDREQLLRELEIGQVRRGVVKNIADFGAFVDLGGIDGLLHIVDMSWSRIGHPSEMVAIDQEIDVMILNIDHEKGKIALGLKQKTPESVGKCRSTLPRRLDRPWFRRQRDELRGLCQAGRGDRRTRAHQRDVLDQARQSSQRIGQHRRRNRRRGPGYRQEEARDLAGYEADPAKSVDQRRRAYTRKTPSFTERSAT